MSDKFDSVPVEKDTTILFSQVAKWGEVDVLYQKWFWDGITAASVIFISEDVQQMSDNTLKQEVKNSQIVNKDSQITIKRSDSGFTFVNFNFET
jgi:hypothetical protein